MTWANYAIASKVLFYINIIIYIHTKNLNKYINTNTFYYLYILLNLFVDVIWKSNEYITKILYIYTVISGLNKSRLII